MENDNLKREKITTLRLMEMNQRSEKISMLTAYDFSSASIIDEAGIDIILVGDSAANVMAGYKTTLPITLDEIIYHAKSVVRAVRHAFVVVDMPFGSYQGSPEDALASAVRIMKETGADCVKLEGGSEMKDAAAKILNAGIPVIGHLGLTPQSINRFGSYGLKAITEYDSQKLLEDAKILEEIGCTAVVLEKIPSILAKKVTELLYIPTIGIGAGPYVDGQVLVFHDLLGINKNFSPRFVRRYADLYGEIENAVKNYIKDVKSGSFPSEKESY